MREEFPGTDEPVPQGAYVPAVVHAGVARSAGMTPRVSGELLVRGVVGADLDMVRARDAAAVAASNALRAVATVAGGLDRVERCLHLTVYLVCAAAFVDHSRVADGASELLRARLGERGAVARSAIGVASLPSGAPIEVELTAAVRR